MHKIIHSSFELDLTPYGVSTVEENYWFSDQFFTKYSFPGTFKLEGELLKTFGNLLDDNAKFIETLFNVQYALGNQLESAIFEIESQIGKDVKFTFRYGFDELPNFDKKLAELPLEETAITDVYAHAKTIISQTWPAVNYNYPQLHTDKFDTTDATWLAFLKIINNYNGTDFLENTFENSLPINRNIIQPFPYFLHILKQGFLDAGFVLKGDILTNELVKKIIVYANTDYFDIDITTTDLNVLRSDYDSEDVVNNHYEYAHQFNLAPDKKYKITGTVLLYPWTVARSSTFSIKYNNQTIRFAYNEWTKIKTLNIEAEFETKSSEGPNYVLDFAANCSSFTMIPGQVLYNLKIEQLPDENGERVLLKEEVNLKNSVPDVTFGKLVTSFRNFFNLDINPIGKDIFVNFIEDNVNYNDALDLSMFEVLKPKKSYQKEVSFLLKFADVSELSYSPVFVNKEGVFYDEKKVDDTTTEITNDVIPLPHKSIDNKFTTCALDNSSEIFITLYSGLINSLNLSEPNDDLLLINIFEFYYKNWINFRIQSKEYSWTFKMYLEEVLKIKQKVFAYGRYMVVKTIDKTQISEDLFEVEIEAETLP